MGPPSDCASSSSCSTTTFRTPVSSASSSSLTTPPVWISSSSSSTLLRHRSVTSTARASSTCSVANEGRRPAAAAALGRSGTHVAMVRQPARAARHEGRQDQLQHGGHAQESHHPPPPAVVVLQREAKHLRVRTWPVSRTLAPRRVRRGGGARTLATRMPITTPNWFSVPNAPRRRFGAISPRYMGTTTVAPPQATPTMKRAATSCHLLRAKAMRTPASANGAAFATKKSLRPKRSAMRPANKAPIKPPMAKMDTASDHSMVLLKCRSALMYFSGEFRTAVLYPNWNAPKRPPIRATKSGMVISSAGCPGRSRPTVPLECSPFTDMATGG